MQKVTKGKKCDQKVNISVMGPSSAQFADHGIGGGGFLQTEWQCSQELQYDFLHTYLQGRGTGSFYLNLKVSLHRERPTVTSVKSVKNLSDYRKDLFSGEPFPTQIHRVLKEMSKEQWN